MRACTCGQPLPKKRDRIVVIAPMVTVRHSKAYCAMTTRKPNMKRQPAEVRFELVYN